MISISFRWLLIVLLLLMAGAVHGEGGCPPGFQPSGAAPSPQAPVACRPIQNYEYQQQAPRPPPPRWIHISGAIALDSEKGIFGTVGSMDNQAIAESTAIMDCRGNGGSNCEIIRSYTDACAAIVTGYGWYAVTIDATSNEAIQSGMDMCANDKIRGCHVYYSECSLAIDVQKRMLSIPVPYSGGMP